MKPIEPEEWVQRMRTRILALDADSNRRNGWGDAIVSVYQRLLFVGYHRDEFGRLLGDRCDAIPIDMRLEVFLEQRFGNPQFADLLENKREATAHAVAAIQSLHSACDIFARICVFAAWSHEPTQAELRTLSIYKAKKKLPEKSQTAVSELVNMSEFKYLTALANTLKHRQVVQVLIQTGLTDGDVRPVIQSFTYGTNNFPLTHYEAKPASHLLRVEMEAIVKQLNIAGESLANEMR